MDGRRLNASVRKRLLNGYTVKINGGVYRYVDCDLRPGDTYIAGRNNLPQVLTVFSVDREDMFVCAVESAYAFDLWECVPVERIR